MSDIDIDNVINITDEANDIYTKLLANEDINITFPDLSDPKYNIPSDSDIYNKIDKPSNDDITTRVVSGSGIYDAIMDAFRAQLKEEVKGNRITSNDYAKALIQAHTAALEAGVQYELQKSQSYWAALSAQIQAITASVTLEEEKVRLASLRYDFLNAKAQYAQTKLGLVNNVISYESAKYNLDNLMPKQADQLDKQNTSLDLSNQTSSYNLNTYLPTQTTLAIDQDSLLKAQISSALIESDINKYNLDNMLPEQLDVLKLQVTSQELQNTISQYNLDNMLPAQLTLTKDQDVYLNTQNQGGLISNQTANYNLSQILPANLKLIIEQMEAQRAQTADVRTDGTTVVGSVGKQKDLYSQQITSFQRDSEYKVANIISSVWGAMKTADPDITPPDIFTNSSIQDVMTNTRNKVGI